MNQGYTTTDGAYAKDGFASFMTTVYVIMFCGLLLTAFAAGSFIMALTYSEALRAIASSGAFMIAMVVIELGLVIVISARINKIKPATAAVLFSLYAIATGITLSFVLLAYASAPWVIFKAFIMASVFFGSMCLYGLVTKNDLTGAGKIFMVGLFSIIIASVVNMFLGSSGLDYIITIVGIGVFVGLTAYDTQMLKNYYYSRGAGDTHDVVTKTAITGALMLYLDFINLFLKLLRLFGRER